MHEVLVNRLGGLSLPRKSVVRLTDRPNMTLDVYRGRKTTIQYNKGFFFWCLKKHKRMYSGISGQTNINELKPKRSTETLYCAIIVIRVALRTIFASPVFGALQFFRHLQLQLIALGIH